LTLSLEEKLKATARETDALLGQLLPPLASPATRLIEAMRYAALGPGKRLRPFLVAESAALFDVPRVLALTVGAALECVHCYSLVHDDLPAMDDDDLRRGRPTAHRAFDEATAILAGDSLLTVAFEILAGLEAAPDIRIRLVSELAKASGMAGMVGGQMLDIAAETRVISDVSEIMLIQNLKTGALFRFACEAGAILSSANPAPLRQYADHIGLAFQIADDILDIESSPETLGKATQKDSGKGKATFVDLMGLDGARRKAEALANDAIDSLSPYGAKADTLRDAARFMVVRRN
jgi:farnesyl diphosphate synthase